MVLIGILMVIAGFALKLDSIAVIIISALATGFAAQMDITINIPISTIYVPSITSIYYIYTSFFYFSLFPFPFFLFLFASCFFSLLCLAAMLPGLHQSALSGSGAMSHQ